MRVMEFMIGNTTIIMNDGRCDIRTEEEIKQSKNRSSNIVYGALLRQMSEKGK